MNFHFITDKQMAVINVPFGDELSKLHVEAIRPSYVTIDGEELEVKARTLTDQQMVSYLSMVQKKLTFGGKVYLEVTNYE